MRDVSQAWAPRKREVWFGWAEMPWASKVRRMSIVACGGFSLEVGVLAFRGEAEERMMAMDVGA